MIKTNNTSGVIVQPRVHIRIATAELGGNGDFLAKLRENFAALGVERALECFTFAHLLCPAIIYEGVLNTGGPAAKRINFHYKPQRP